MNRFWYLVLLSGFVFSFGAGCDLFGSGEDPGAIRIQLLHQVDGEDLALNTGSYTNRAGNQYSVSLLEYVLSDITLEGEDGTRVAIADFHYVNEASFASNRIEKDPIPGGRYTYLRFRFGIPNNVAGEVANTLEFNGMAWPAQMAGGTAGLFHNMRLEGKYQVGTNRDDVASFLTHTGPTGGVDRSFEVPLPINIVVDDSRAEIAVVMNINAWYENPVTVDLSTIDPPLIMGNAVIQDILLQNAANVFSIQSDS